ncbi:MAG: 5-formyltetrahydrofolate cyclo-ligase, partial [Deltaproteobacteria bacterium]
NRIREKIWKTLEKEKVALFPGARGRIPNFKGADKAAQLLAMLPDWKNARAIKANPDSPQRPVRHLALISGKTVYMAAPRLREERCFVKLDPGTIPLETLRDASTIKGAFQYGIPVHPREMPSIELIVAGSVTVNRKGARLGKGGGYSDLEYALGREFGFVRENVVIVTTVHPLQIVEEELPETDHDFRIDYIITAEEIIPTHRLDGRPSGILRDHLTEQKISEIPILKEILNPT